jgi:hypothetical protein
MGVICSAGQKSYRVVAPSMNEYYNCEHYFLLSGVQVVGWPVPVIVIR